MAFSLLEVFPLSDVRFQRGCRGWRTVLKKIRATRLIGAIRVQGAPETAGLVKR